MLPCTTLSNHSLHPVLPLSTPSYGVFYCQRTLDSTPSCLLLPQLTTSYPVVPSYPSLQRPTLHSSASLPRPSLSYPSLPYLLLPSLTHPTPPPTLSHLPTLSYIIFYCHPTSQPTLSYASLPHITTAYLVLPCPTLAYSILPHPTPANPS